LERTAMQRKIRKLKIIVTLENSLLLLLRRRIQRRHSGWSDSDYYEVYTLITKINPTERCSWA
jgi:hypothetical protein